MMFNFRHHDCLQLHLVMVNSMCASCTLHVRSSIDALILFSLQLCGEGDDGNGRSSHHSISTHSNSSLGVVFNSFYLSL